MRAAVCVALLALVAGAFAAQVETTVGSYSVIMDDSPKFEFWPSAEDRPKKGTERNWVAFKNIKMCNGATDECQQVDMPALTWNDVSSGPGTLGDDARIIFSADGTPGVHPFGRLTIQVGIQDADDTEVINTGLDLTSHIAPYGPSTSYKITLQRSHNDELTFTAGSTARLGSSTAPVSGGQQGNQVFVTFNAPATAGSTAQSLSVRIGRFGTSHRTTIAIGIAGAGAAAGAVVIVGALAFRGWRSKSKKDDEFEPIEMALP